MKKNGKKYRKLQKAKDNMKSVANAKPIIRINQKIRDVDTALLSVSQIISANPIANDNAEIKREYISRLKSYIKIIGESAPKYGNAALALYEKIILSNDRTKKKHEIGFYKYFILFDLIHIIGYKTDNISQAKLDKVEKKYLSDFPSGDNAGKCFQRIMKSVNGSTSRLTYLEKSDVFANESEYISLIKRNLKFMRKAPYGVIVTATMSAGKSTFINALTGKCVSLSRTMACTGKIHTIVNKSFEDGYSYEYDHDLSLDVSSDCLLNDNEHNSTDKIVAAVHFYGTFSKKRLIISDSPGVNFSGAPHHKKIADKLIEAKNYNLLVYVMNATQLATDDENIHLDFVKKTIGNTPVIFVINKVDVFSVEDEDIVGIINRQVEFLEKKGFESPVVCPISARAGYLSKMFGTTELSRIERRELYNYVDKFYKMKLTDYYSKRFKTVKIPNSSQEEKQLLKTCGFAYVEKIINSFITGGQINGTDLR